MALKKPFHSAKPQNKFNPVKTTHVAEKTYLVTGDKASTMTGVCSTPVIRKWHVLMPITSRVSVKENTNKSPFSFSNKLPFHPYSNNS